MRQTCCKLVVQVHCKLAEKNNSLSGRYYSPSSKPFLLRDPLFLSSWNRKVKLPSYKEVTLFSTLFYYRVIRRWGYIPPLSSSNRIPSYFLKELTLTMRGHLEDSAIRTHGRESVGYANHNTNWDSNRAGQNRVFASTLCHIVKFTVSTSLQTCFARRVID
ncbi:hypothetical protein AVEN_73036-1 [Araneus ventricosus]|uniref:Uncharacterized protein n=1 Tax=Araneus ventricosus TaxID=182803 RepID=A0A4Y2W4N4_ARAVE|nr:hypothetical protein AVEN_247833-1 [Araneus ventricosus]GBO31474.1 hypothetical protein AVEN_29284-1 [Araneus ventricosus]GBO31476.1 hypothetical protein AVEN_32944-1 [Araneus ventricosus]GBO31478.1 hypothetical protein AVEN_73036-1 [Araneus ventricosus]